MKRLLTTLPLAALLLTVAACGPQANHADENATAAATSAEHEADSAAPDDAAAGHAAAEGEGQALLPIMQRLGAEMMTLRCASMRRHARATSKWSPSAWARPSAAAWRVTRSSGRGY